MLETKKKKCIEFTKKIYIKFQEEHGGPGEHSWHGALGKHGLVSIVAW